MPIAASVVIAIIEGLINQLPSVIAAYSQWVADINAGSDPTASQLKLTEAALDLVYSKLRAATAVKPA